MRYTIFIMNTTILHEDGSDYGRYKIVEMHYEGRPARVLFSDGKAPQSGIALDDDPELLFDYNQRLLEIALSTRPQSVLVIGGGTLTLPFALSQHLPASTIDVVEIDELLPQLAERYFHAINPSQVHLHIADGVSYMRSCRKKYDFIIVDAFYGFTIAQPLLTEELASLYNLRLTKNGFVAINFISKYLTRKHTLARELQSTFSSVFGSVELYPADHEYAQRAEQNLLLVAAKSSHPSFDYLQSSAVEIPVTTH